MECVSIEKLLFWVYEAQSASTDWRRQAWTDWEFRDGKHWTQADFYALRKKGINPLTINRIFPLVNLIYGNFLRNQQDIVAKGRTKYDTELGQVMSEALMFVRDSNMGRLIIPQAFNDEITAGFGYLAIGKNPDPRKETVQWMHKPWYSLYWDPYGSPYLTKESCRYVFTSEWTNLDNILMLFWEKKKEIMDKFSQLSADRAYVPSVFDPGQEIEDYRSYLSSGQWVDSGRKRVKPTEMWYTTLCPTLFAKMPNERIIDVDAIPNLNEQFEVLRHSTELIKAVVKKTRVATFISDLLLQDVPSPYMHDEYPFVPFVGYLDRYNSPFGVPRQIIEQNMEVNKRRSMALALIGSRRTIAEEGAVDDHQRAMTEVNRHDGYLKVKNGKLNAIKIQEMAELASPQVELMRQSEREIQEIAGTADEALQSTSYLQSAVGLEKKQEMTGTVTASLFNNANYALMRLGQLSSALIQENWTAEKVFRITDRLSGTEKFVTINERIATNEGTIVIKNNIQEAQFDLIMSRANMTDSMREKNMDLLLAAINKVPPEAVGDIINMAFEISDLPDKELLLKRLQSSLGISPVEDQMTEEQRNQVYAEKQAQKERMQGADYEMSMREREAKLQTELAQAIKARVEADKIARDADREDWQMGHQLGQEMLKAASGTTEKPKEKVAA